jgi:uncharacterized protein YijF (DUF1287 family)
LALAACGSFIAARPWKAGNETAAQREFLGRLSDAAIERTTHVVRYDGAYVRIQYPGGDVPADTGVCTD